MVAKINRLVQFILLLIALAAANPISAAAEGISLISDAETQNYLSKIVKPLFIAAGVNFDQQRIFIINDNSLNAFVSDGNYLFVHTGTLLAAQNTNELAGILAHETGHIMGGHIVQQKIKMENMQYVMLGSVLAAGAAAVSTGRGDAAMAVLLGSQSSALNSMIHYQMHQERSADESAIKLLDKTKQSTAGLLAFMQKIKKNNTLSGIDEQNYFRTHPLTSERIAHFTEASKHNHYSSANSLDKDLQLIQAKLAAFLLPTSKVNRLYPQSANSAAAKYAHSILAFREGNIAQSLKLLQELCDKYPQSPYFIELKGQFLFESGRLAESIKAYEQALKLLPNNHLLQTGLAQAILENNPSKQQNQQAIGLLQKALLQQNSALNWQLLARAYEKDGRHAYAYYATAEFNYALGKTEAAQEHLRRAEKSQPDKFLQIKINDLKTRLKEE